MPDVPIAVEITPERALFVHIMSGKAYEVNEKTKYEGRTWWETRPSVVVMPASSWKELKVFIITMCQKTKRCGKEVQNWDRSVEIIDTTINERIP